MDSISFSSRPKKRVRFLWLILLLGFIIFCMLSVTALLAPPKDFPVPYQFTIEPGQTLFSLSNELSADHAIQSPRIFELLMIGLGSERRISEGDYYFDAPASVIDIALRISGRQFGVNRTKITFPEGFSTTEMALRLSTTFPGFDTRLFMSLAKNKEGYLFPDTYGFFASVSPDFVINTMERTFASKTAALQKEAQRENKNWSNLIIMASIIEKEAAGDEDRKIVSGILWKRLENGMPLQVDAPFLYLIGKKSSELTRADLSMNSLYNTYVHKGLPPTPITNPGLAAIDASLHPQASAYLYYLHDDSGQIHYASTYPEHQKNIKTYLK